LCGRRRPAAVAAPPGVTNSQVRNNACGQEPVVPAEFQSIPIVDIAGLSAPELGVRRAVAREIGLAARQVGFLYVTGHGVPQALSADLREVAEARYARFRGAAGYQVELATDPFA